MKKKWLFALALTISLTAMSCGGGDDASKKNETKSEKEVENEDEMMEDEAETEESSYIETSDFDMSASEAMEKYKSMLTEYEALIEAGNEEEAEALRSSMNALEKAAGDALDGDEMQALRDLSDMAFKLENGEEIDMEDALDAYGSALDAAASMTDDPAAKEAMDQAKDAMKQLENMPGIPK